MSRLRLKPTGKTLIRVASRQEVEDYFVDLPVHDRRTKWIRKGNQYRVDCTAVYGKDLNAGTVNHTHLIHYIAASGPAHAIDGWSLLGRAIDSALRGDTYSAVHFAYYAELRAAMALLACEGVGIFNNRHPTISVGGTTTPLPKVEFVNSATGTHWDSWAGTHAIIWPCLLQWSGLKRAGKLLEQCVQPRGNPLSAWLQACGASTPARAIGQAWLNSWGVDLAAFDDDHDARNLASYRPSEFRLPAAIPAIEVVTFVEELWQLFEPSAGMRFPVLERYLLRRALRAAAINKVSIAQIETVGLPTMEATEWANFLNKTDDPVPLRDADHVSNIDAPRCHLQIMARAVLLLHVATSAASRLLRNANYSAEDISHWWHRFGETRGLWESGGVPESPLDTWADIAESIQASGTWRSQTPPPTGASLRAWRRRQPSALDDFGACEMIAIWGLTP